MHERKKNLREEWQRKREEKEKEMMRDKPQINHRVGYKNGPSPVKSKVAACYGDIAR